MIRSQENCLTDNHRLTHEVWGGDYSRRLGLFLSFALINSWYTMPGVFIYAYCFTPSLVEIGSFYYVAEK